MAGCDYSARPCHQLQIPDEDRVEHRHEQQRDERREREPADLRVAERLPQWPPCVASGNRAITVAATVISTGRRRTMPASSSASRSGSPARVRSSMKSKSTMTWLTITPIEAGDAEERHEAERLPHEPQRRRAPPTMPYGIAANTISGLTAFLNCRTSAR